MCIDRSGILCLNPTQSKNPASHRYPPAATLAYTPRHICTLVHGQWRRSSDALRMKLAAPHLCTPPHCDNCRLAGSVDIVPSGASCLRVEVGTDLSQYLAVSLLPRGFNSIRLHQYQQKGADPMRITLNATSASRLLRIMSQRGVSNPTHMINLLLDEAAMQQPIPVIEDVYDHSNNQQYPAA